MSKNVSTDISSSFSRLLDEEELFNVDNDVQLSESLVQRGHNRVGEKYKHLRSQRATGKRASSSSSFSKRRTSVDSTDEIDDEFSENMPLSESLVQRGHRYVGEKHKNQLKPLKSHRQRSSSSERKASDTNKELDLSDEDTVDEFTENMTLSESLVQRGHRYVGEKYKNQLKPLKSRRQRSSSSKRKASDTNKELDLSDEDTVDEFTENMTLSESLVQRGHRYVGEKYKNQLKPLKSRRQRSSSSKRKASDTNKELDLSDEDTEDEFTENMPLSESLVQRGHRYVGEKYKNQLKPLQSRHQSSSSSPSSERRVAINTNKALDLCDDIEDEVNDNMEPSTLEETLMSDPSPDQPDLSQNESSKTTPTKINTRRSSSYRRISTTSLGLASFSSPQSAQVSSRLESRNNENIVEEEEQEVSENNVHTSVPVSTKEDSILELSEISSTWEQEYLAKTANRDIEDEVNDNMEPSTLEETHMSDPSPDQPDLSQNESSKTTPTKINTRRSSSYRRISTTSLESAPFSSPQSAQVSSRLESRNNEKIVEEEEQEVSENNVHTSVPVSTKEDSILELSEISSTWEQEHLAKTANRDTMMTSLNVIPVTSHDDDNESPGGFSSIVSGENGSVSDVSVLIDDSNDDGDDESPRGVSSVVSEENGSVSDVSVLIDDSNDDDNVSTNESVFLSASESVGKYSGENGESDDTIKVNTSSTRPEFIHEIPPSITRINTPLEVTTSPRQPMSRAGLLAAALARSKTINALDIVDADILCNTKCPMSGTVRQLKTRCLYPTLCLTQVAIPKTKQQEQPSLAVSRIPSKASSVQQTKTPRRTKRPNKRKMSTSTVTPARIYSSLITSMSRTMSQASFQSSQRSTTINKMTTSAAPVIIVNLSDRSDNDDSEQLEERVTLNHLDEKKQDDPNENNPVDHISDDQRQSNELQNSPETSVHSVSKATEEISSSSRLSRTQEHIVSSDEFELGIDYNSLNESSPPKRPKSISQSSLATHSPKKASDSRTVSLASRGRKRVSLIVNKSKVDNSFNKPNNRTVTSLASSSSASESRKSFSQTADTAATSTREERKRPAISNSSDSESAIGEENNMMNVRGKTQPKNKSGPALKITSKKATSSSSSEKMMKRTLAKLQMNSNMIQKDYLNQVLCEWGLKFSKSMLESLHDLLNRQLETLCDKLCEQAARSYGMFTYRQLENVFQQMKLVVPSLGKNSLLLILASILPHSTYDAAKGYLIPREGQHDTI